MNISNIDQVVAYKGRIREKPQTAEQCRQYLASYADEPACTVTAVVVCNTQTGRRFHGVDVAKQWFLPIPSDVVDGVIAKGDILHCAGWTRIHDYFVMIDD